MFAIYSWPDQPVKRQFEVSMSEKLNILSNVTQSAIPGEPKPPSKNVNCPNTLKCPESRLVVYLANCPTTSKWPKSRKVENLANFPTLPKSLEVVNGVGQLVRFSDWRPLLNRLSWYDTWQDWLAYINLLIWFSNWLFFPLGSFSIGKIVHLVEIACRKNVPTAFCLGKLI